jgi:hypothetical protein
MMPSRPSPAKWVTRSIALPYLSNSVHLKSMFGIPVTDNDQIPPCKLTTLDMYPTKMSPLSLLGTRLALPVLGAQANHDA